MKLKVEATPDELRDKAPDIVKSIGELLRPVSPDMADILEKAIPYKEKELKFPVLRELQKQTEEAYEKQMELMLKDIGKVLDKSVKTTTIKKSERSPDYTQKLVAKEDESYEEIKEELKKYGYVDSDFDKGGVLFGYSTNQLIDLAREKRDSGE
jgi:hypothetical protein